MLEWISRKHRDQKRKLEREEALKKSLAEKVQRFQPVASDKDTGYTELTINGKKLRVNREHITLQPVSPITVVTSTA